MKLSIHLFIILQLLFNGIILTQTDTYNPPVNLEFFLPDSSEMLGWMPDGDVEVVSGENLYLAINGGAEIYHEYGFKNALYQTYINAEEDYINLEIYEMQSNAAAFGIFSFKRSITGTPIKFGFEGCLESYYLNFWKGNYLVTITSMKPDSTYTEDLIKIAAAIDKKTDYSSTPPALTSYLPEEGLLQNGITYLKGNLSLFNQGILEPKNIFDLKEGILGQYPDYKILIIKYLNNQDCLAKFSLVEKYFMNNILYKNFKKHDSYFEVYNHKNNMLAIKSYQDFIFVIQSKETMSADKYFQKIEDKINNTLPDNDK